MDMESLFSAALGISTPWFVKSITFDPKLKRMHKRVTYLYIAHICLGALTRNGSHFFILVRIISFCFTKTSADRCFLTKPMSSTIHFDTLKKAYSLTYGA